VGLIIDHGTWPLRPEDEGLHEPGPEQLWNESYYFDFAADDGSVAGYVRLGLYPNWDQAWYWACVVRPGHPLVLVADNQASLPQADLQIGGRSGTGSYSSGQQIIRPLESARVTVNTAAAAVLPDPSAAYHDLSGADSIALALDLEWTTVGGVYPYKDLPRYEIPCEVTGTIQVGDEKIAITGHGERDHSWGPRDWWQISWLWSSGRLADGTAFHGMQANIGIPLPWPSFTVAPEQQIAHRDGFWAATEFGPDDFPAVSRFRLAGEPVTVTPVCFAPVAMTAPDGRVAHFPRALCRFETPDGRAGFGWTEWNQPPGWRDHDWSGATEQLPG
jgi:hypothetical protein